MWGGESKMRGLGRKVWCGGNTALALGSKAWVGGVKLGMGEKSLRVGEYSF